MAVYAEDLQSYMAVSEFFRQRAEVPREKVETEFQNARATSKDSETRGVALKPNEIWYTICVAECVMSKDPINLFGYRCLDFDKDVSYDALTSSEESGLDVSKATMASRTSTITSKQQAKGPEGKTAPQVGPSLKNAIIGCGLECCKANH